MIQAVTFWSPNVEGHYLFISGHISFHHPKKVTNCEDDQFQQCLVLSLTFKLLAFCEAWPTSRLMVSKVKDVEEIKLLQCLHCIEILLRVDIYSHRISDVVNRNAWLCLVGLVFWRPCFFFEGKSRPNATMCGWNLKWCSGGYIFWGGGRRMFEWPCEAGRPD